MHILITLSFCWWTTCTFKGCVSSSSSVCLSQSVPLSQHSRYMLVGPEHVFHALVWSWPVCCLWRWSLESLQEAAYLLSKLFSSGVQWTDYKSEVSWISLIFIFHGVVLESVWIWSSVGETLKICMLLNYWWFEWLTVYKV